MVIGDAINGARGDMNDTIDLLELGLLEHDTRALHLRGKDVGRGKQGQGRGRVNDDAYALEGRSDGRSASNIPGDDPDLAPEVLVLKGADVERRDLLASG
jgi:hypothetical protein